MIIFFRSRNQSIYAVETKNSFESHEIDKLIWLFGEAENITDSVIASRFIGPRKEMITPWSTNAVEITQNMGIGGIFRIEKFIAFKPDHQFDPMLEVIYEQLDQSIFNIPNEPSPVQEITNIAEYNQSEGLALSDEEVTYLEKVASELGRPLTDSEVFGFSQVNSEHCRHKIFNGTFIIDGKEKESSLFKLIKKTSEANPNFIVSAYKDNVAFIQGPEAYQFAPKTQNKADFFSEKLNKTVLSLKAETHNFPTTVEPFNGAATGTGGEIRDRLAGGKGSLPLAGTAVYMTSYSRLEKDRSWEEAMAERQWLYQTPMDILIKASDGASDFGNKFGQPLITGSLLTFEHTENNKLFGYDKVIMQAGGIGYGKAEDSLKDAPEKGDRIVILGGDNYRIGMGGSAVSSVATGEFGNSIELNAIQRSNPEMQKRAMNAIRAMAESDNNPIVSIHDHGAGGHLNCLSELVEETGGTIDIHQLPIGDPTLSDKEIAGNESQERMGLVIKEEDLKILKEVSDRERAPMYNVGSVTGDQHFKFENKRTGKNPIDWNLSHMFGSSPKTILTDDSGKTSYKALEYSEENITNYIHQILQLEAVACKDWLTNKVDRSVTGKVATQQTTGPIQLPLNNVAVMAIDYSGLKGVATSIGHAPIAGLINPTAGSRLSIAEALTNLVWAPLTHGLKGVSLSANWMWPAKTEGENARLYEAVEGISEFAQALGINIPTGKDSLSMTQKYPDGKTVYSPGTVIISTIGEVININKTISPTLKPDLNSSLIYIDFSRGSFELGGSSFSQILNQLGDSSPNVEDSDYFKRTFETLQDLIKNNHILSGHDISAGGMITSLLEMCFPTSELGLAIDLNMLDEQDALKIMFSEQPGVIVQVNQLEEVTSVLKTNNVKFVNIGKVTNNRELSIDKGGLNINLDIDDLRDVWFKTSYLLDKKQSGNRHATLRFENYKKQPLDYTFPSEFKGSLESYEINNASKKQVGTKATIIREKGVNGDREMAWALHLAGFEVKDIHMTDLISGREDLTDVNMIAFVGGFSNSDVLGSAKGWAGAFLYNEKAKQALDNFYARPDTLSLGVCNGCQLMMELGLLYPELKEHPKMHHNGSGKFESAFISLNIPENNSVMLNTLANTKLGVWLAHGEGRFEFNLPEKDYNIVSKYAYGEYPANPNDSDFATAAVCSNDGRHLAIMPHLERTIYPYNWPHYPSERVNDEVSPWIEAFINARKWVEER